MQMAVIEAARNLLDLRDAGSEEFAAGAAADFTPVVYYLKEWMEAGTRGCSAAPRTPRAARCASAPIPRSSPRAARSRDLRHHRRSPSATATATRSTSSTATASRRRGCCLSGLSPDGRLPEIVEMPDHPWYIGVQFHPELKSKPFAPHPLFADFIRAAVEQSRLVT
jgi:CTP synthase